jgi:26S proteasome regulatory subunit T4
MSVDPEREKALEDYKNSLLQSREWEAKLKALRLEIKGLQRDYDVSEENIKALQSVGQIIGEVLKQLDEERCTPLRAISEFRRDTITDKHQDLDMW